MPVVAVDYPIADRLLLKATGTINLSEMIMVMAHFRSSDARLKSILFDLQDATISVSDTEVESLAQMMASEMKKAPMGPVVLIATNDEVSGMARMYQAYSTASGRPEVGVFRDLSSAEQWLERLVSKGSDNV
jgi:hypothetical protein